METVPSQKTLAFWAENNFNVLFVGEHGIGKSAIIMEAFTSVFGEMNKNWLYFSGSTLDPWVDFVGTPKEKIVEGESVLSLVRPEIWNNDIQAIFIDEFNRSHKKIRNATMELIQFKSINGKKFPNLKVVWVAINPHTEEETYSVEPLDPAQMDRFQIHVTLPYQPDIDFFIKKYDEKGKLACEWWNGLSENLKKLVSPRRLEYGLQVHAANGDIRYVFDQRVGFKSFVDKLNSAGLDEEIKKAIESFDDQPMQDLFNKYMTNKDFFVKINKPYILDKVVPKLNKEQIASHFKDFNQKVFEKIAPQPEVQKVLKEVFAAGLVGIDERKNLEKLIVKDAKELEKICDEILTIRSLTRDTQERKKQMRRIIKAIADIENKMPDHIRKKVEEVLARMGNHTYGNSSAQKDIKDIKDQLDGGKVNNEEMIEIDGDGWDSRGNNEYWKKKEYEAQKKYYNSWEKEKDTF